MFLRSQRFLLAFACTVCSLVPTVVFLTNCQAQEATNPWQAEELLHWLKSDDLDRAIERTSQNAPADPKSTRTIAALIQLARVCEQDGRSDASAGVYYQAARCAEQLRATGEGVLSDARCSSVWTAAAKSLTTAGRHEDAFHWLDQSLTLESLTGSKEQQQAAEQLLVVASGLLDDGELQSANRAYARAGALLKDDSLATARLGLAWTLVMLGDHEQQALDAVDLFLQQHEGHPDTPSVLLIQHSCLSRMGQVEAANNTLEQLVSRWAKSEAALQAVLGACSTSPLGDLSPSVANYLVESSDKLLRSPRSSSKPRVLACGLIASVNAGSDDREQDYASAIAVVDQVGDVATSVLEQLINTDHVADAERIALSWISPPKLSADETQGQSGSPVEITIGVREAACRWAGRTGRWSMLAMAAEEEMKLAPLGQAASEETRGRSLHVDRLFAEALLQTGKTAKSLKLWKAIVDQGGADDFPTLLRLAEAAAAEGSIAEATRRIASAKATASVTDGETALVDLLAADVHIRQLNFDRGRALLEQVVRSAGTQGSIRGRAQWMIGETFFMQERFSDAIAAYRQVEGIGGDPEWTAASLVQAGKSFEQLGRTREATVCYSTLVNRFSESRHATGARRRLASLSREPTSPQTPIRR